ncbi:hypothetical protein MUU72_04575 [Streptomyces sp. RS10V-4]|uniref:hypothetical protein n=1 Tax=Streptomyces rhizoryzae TaxID=2932493 RepID=UPI0020031722|nr:hypothetical protein [Streptomyces rhizoryzae]MCK7622399.1 hypothetical protein [Streptomyces rhizoryzae]
MAQLTARRVVTAQVVLIAGAALALLIREIPGLVREIRIWRMAAVPSGARHPR